MDQLLKSIHVHWMEGWMQAFPREAFLVLRLEDWKHSKTGLRDMLLQVIAFLQLTPVDASTLEKMVALPKRTFTGRATYIEGRGRIEPATRARLRAFFDPYNRRCVFTRSCRDGFRNRSFFFLTHFQAGQSAE